MYKLVESAVIGTRRVSPSAVLLPRAVSLSLSMLALVAVALCALAVATNAEQICSAQTAGDSHIPNSFKLETQGPFYFTGATYREYYVDENVCNTDGNNEVFLSAVTFKACDGNGQAPKVLALDKTRGRVTRVGSPYDFATVYVDVFCAPRISYPKESEAVPALPSQDQVPSASPLRHLYRHHVFSYSNVPKESEPVPVLPGQDKMPSASPLRHLYRHNVFRQPVSPDLPQPVPYRALLLPSVSHRLVNNLVAVHRQSRVNERSPYSGRNGDHVPQPYRGSVYGRGRYNRNQYGRGQRNGPLGG